MEKQRIRVGIIGAGLSGLLACKYVFSKGFHPIVFESRTSIGGVWLKTLETTKLQTPKPFYQFSDFPWPTSVTEDYPSGQTVFDYIDSYARHFDLIKHVKFDANVVGIEYEGVSEEEIRSWSLWGGNGDPFSSTAKWKIVVKTNQSVETQVYSVDFVIVCVGRFSDVPNTPEFPPNKGAEAFDGKVIHSMDYSKMDNEEAAKFIKGKRVTVVGVQKSALDIANECSLANGIENPCTVLYKKEHWLVPSYKPWGVPFQYIYFTRLAELSIHKPDEGLLLSLIATFLSPLRWAFSTFIETYMLYKLPLVKFGMVPKHRFLQDFSACTISTVPDRFFENVEKGSVVFKKATSFGFCSDGILVDGETTPIDTDLVILATGFKGEKKLKDIFVSQMFQDDVLGSPNESVPLYRECIHPRIPQLAVIGFSESISNLYTSEMRCRWVAELLDGTFKLPSIEKMDENVAKWSEYMKQSSGDHYRRCCIGPIHIWYNDLLCKDMKLNPMRKNGFFANLFHPYGPMDYATS